MARRERSLDAAVGVLAGFAAGLRRLRQEAGNPTYRELAKRTHYSIATLSTAAGGRKLPSLTVTLAYVRACGGDEQVWERRWHAVAAELAQHDEVEVADRDTPPGSSASDRPPYVGLSAFQPEDAEWFFGRERLVEQLLDRLSQRRFVVVFGASGVGKSSVLRAGLLPRWQAETGIRSVVLFTPGPHPVEECAIHLASVADYTPGQLVAELTADPHNLHRVIRQVLAGQPDGAELAVIVDQFEEVFTLCRSDTERGHFIDMLITAADAPNSRCRIVLGVRADFYAHCTTHPRLVEVLADAQLAVGPMSSDELRRCIVQPAVRAHCTLEGALLAELVAHAAGNAGVLPMLSHVLLETWRRRRGNTLTLAGFQAAGGVDGALARTAESVYTALTPAQQHLAKELFLRLIALGEGTEDTKRRIHRTELDTTDTESGTDSDDGRNVGLVVDRLAQQRLITVDRDSVEITHEALIRCWPRLHGWLSEDREGLRMHRRLTDAADEWTRLGGDPGTLWRGTRLALTDGWAASKDRVLAAREREFLEASWAAHAAEQATARRRSRRLRQLVALLTVLLVVATTAGVLAVQAQRTAVRQRDIATSQRVATEAARLRGTRPAFAAQLALAAYRLAPIPEARSSLLSAFAVPYATLLTSSDGMNGVATSPDGHTLATASSTATLWDTSDGFHPRHLADVGTDVTAVAVHPQGHSLATAATDGTVRLWDTTNPRQPRDTARLDTNSSTVSFHPSGRLLVTAGTAGTVWDVSDTAHPQRVASLGTDLATAVFSPRGTTLAVVGKQSGVQLWDATTPGQPRETARLDTTATAAAFNPDGHLLATAGTDFTVRLWDVTDPRQPRPLSTLSGHTDVARSVTFAPDGRTLASGSVDASVRLWDVTEPMHPRDVLVLTGHTGAVNALAYNPDGHTLATASADHTVRLWDLPGPALIGHTNSVYSVTFNPDGHLLASGSYDTTVRLWDVTEPRRPRELAVLSGHTAPVYQVAFSPDGHYLASGSTDTTIRLWDIAQPQHPRDVTVLTAHTAPVNAIAYSPDGHTLVTGSDDHTAKLWDLTTPHDPRLLATVTGHTDAINAVIISPDNHTLATGSADRTTRLWDITHPQGPRPLATLTGHTDAVKTLVISPDNHTLITGSADRTARLWDIADPRHSQELATTSGYTDAVNLVVISPDGTALAAASADRTTRLWDVTHPRSSTLLATLSGHNKPVDAAAFHPNGSTLATGSEDWTTLLWETNPERMATNICVLTDPAISPADWERYFPGLDYQPPCGRT
jgi:WD40 repeat protein